ncbi:MAG: RidA family protein [Thermomicrobiales bacterium]
MHDGRSRDTNGRADEPSDRAVIERLRPEGLVRNPAFSHVAVVPPGATTIHVGGQNAVDADGALVGANDLAAQAVRALENVITALAAVDAGVADVVQWTVLFVAGSDIGVAYQAIAPLIAVDEPALVTAAGVVALGMPGALIEIGAIAAVMR